MSELSVGERCFVFHGPVLYEAKMEYFHDANSPTVTSKKEHEVLLQQLLDANRILEIPSKLKGKPCFFIHYKGWPKSWDEWVDPIRIIPFTPENIKKLKDLKQAALDLSKNDSVSRKVEIEVLVRDEDSDNLFPTRIKKQLLMDMAEKYVTKPLINLEMPPQLRTRLVEDWENVEMNNHLVALPAQVSIDEIFDEFVTYFDRHTPKLKGRLTGLEAESDYLLYSEFQEEFLQGLKVFFNRKLDCLILYDNEQQQYQEFAQTQSKTSIYGFEHLLRLLVVFLDIVNQLNLDPQALEIGKFHISHLYKFLGQRILRQEMNKIRKSKWI